MYLCTYYLFLTSFVTIYVYDDFIDVFSDNKQTKIEFNELAIKKWINVFITKSLYFSDFLLYIRDSN